MSSWACVQGHWATGDCYTPSGATFPEQIQLDVYDPSNLSTPIASSKQTFNIPYRPSASPKCGDGRWYSSGLKTCFNGYANDVTFNFGGNSSSPALASSSMRSRTTRPTTGLARSVRGRHASAPTLAAPTTR